MDASLRIFWYLSDSQSFYWTVAFMQTMKAVLKGNSANFSVKTVYRSWGVTLQCKNKIKKNKDKAFCGSKGSVFNVINYPSELHPG